MMHTRIQGYAGEDRVAQHLEREGFCIVARNYTINIGEIDIIARKDTLTIFVEVKMRNTPTYFDLSEVISSSKQKKIIRTAKYWMISNPSSCTSYRFDVALIEHEQITYIPDAFHAQDV